jgi:hypothetical protein
LVACVVHVALGGAALRKNLLVDRIEIALIQLQYALADYYCCSESDLAIDPAAIETALRELQRRAISTQLAIDIARDAANNRPLAS